MSKKSVVTLVVTMVGMLSVLSLPVRAQEPPAGESVPVSGTFDYTPEVFGALQNEGNRFVDATEAEVWSGDFEGTAEAPFRAVVRSNGEWEAWILATFEGVVLGDKEGTMVIMSVYKRPSATAQWTGEWMILSGTGDLENVHGGGATWGPGNNPEDPDASPEIFWSGEIIFPATE